MPRSCLASIVCLFAWAAAVSAGETAFQIGTFSADVTIPLGHRCMGILPRKAERIEDELEARGFVLTGGPKPVVLLALDWCEVRNGAYDQWRDALAKAAGTTRQHVLVCSIHQHDAPVSDSGAQELLDEVGLQRELYDPEFHAECIQRAARALQASLMRLQPVTHLGVGQAAVEKVASNRRVELPDGRPSFSRYSASARDPFLSQAPEGLIDPLLKTISFWNGDKPLVALHAYATHPMSYYGKGGVTADFVGLARRRMQSENPALFQIYVSGCSGDVTAGKYNDGSAEMRAVLADRIYEGMKASWKATRRHELGQVEFRSAALDLPFHDGAEFKEPELRKTLADTAAKIGDRILAAMSLSSLQRIAAGQPIDLPCLDLGPAQVVLFPGEAFVGYQLLAQELRPDATVMSIGYGECWPGYIPTKSAFEEGFGHGWRWVAPGCEPRIEAALREVLQTPTPAE